MKTFHTAELKVHQNEILQLLGYKDRLPQDEVLGLIAEEIDQSGEYLEPALYYEDVEIERIERDSVILKNQVSLEGEFITSKLSNCFKITATIATVGNKVTERVRAAFEQDDYLRAMVIDSIGIAALGNLNKRFWYGMIDTIAGTDFGITQPLSPGDTDWKLQEQKKIFQCLGSGFHQIKLTEYCLMFPEKSTAQIYGIGKNIGVERQGHTCSECSLRHCSYRQDGKVELVVSSEGTREVIDVESGANLLEILRNDYFFAESPCSGLGLCGKCKVKIERGISEPNEYDQHHLTKNEIGNGWRLACRIQIKGPMEVTLERKEGIEILTSGRTRWYEVQPLAERIDLQMAPPSIHDQRSDLQRLSDAYGANPLLVRLEDMAQISRTLRDYQFHVTAVIFQGKLLALAGNGGIKEFYGIAADLGTTTVAVYLMNLCDGTQIDVESAVNSQGAYGADVISRINYTIENSEGLTVLKNLIREQLNGMIGALCRRNGISESSIYHMTMVGNSVMTHFLLGLPCYNIAQAPYIPVTNHSVEVEASELGLKLKGMITILPAIAAYVGSDITAGILSCGMLESKGYSLLLDLGTNGEMVIGNCDEILTCSTAAGPAFEGANIRFGIGGVRGAINKIDLSRNRIYETIDSAEPVGICGSGVLDATAQLLHNGIVDGRGRMHEPDDSRHRNLIIEIDGMKQMVVAHRKSNKDPITFTQKDVREVQLAKAAIRAGINLLLKEKELDYNQIENVYIGGGFGNFMNTESAVAIGMIPWQLRDKIRSVGNCAGSGAKAYLLSKELGRKAVEISGRARYIELAARKEFQEYFIEEMAFESN